MGESSTRSCLTILIDPGDLMKIHGFTSKQTLNGATVEVVRKSSKIRQRQTVGRAGDQRGAHKKHQLQRQTIDLGCGDESQTLPVEKRNRAGAARSKAMAFSLRRNDPN